METPGTFTKRSTWLTTGLGRQATEDRVMLRRRGTHSGTVQKTDEFPQMQFLEKIALNDWCLVVTVQTTVEVPQMLRNPCGDSAGAVLGQV